MDAKTQLSIDELCRDYCTDIQNCLGNYHFYQFKACVIRFNRGIIAEEELKESIAKIFSNYPDVWRRYPNLIPTGLETDSFQKMSEIFQSLDYDDNFVDNLKVEKYPRRCCKASLIVNMSLVEESIYSNRNPTLEDVERIIQSDSDFVKLTNKDGQLPLHIACIYGAPFDVISTMVRAYPEAVNVRDNHGRYPLHHYFTIYNCISWSDAETNRHIPLYSRKKDFNFFSLKAINLIATTEIITAPDHDEDSPLKILSAECAYIDKGDEDALVKAKHIINLLMDLEPPLCILLFKSVSSFPYELVTHTANHRFIKEKLNEAATGFLFFAIIMLDLVIRLAIIITFYTLPLDRMDSTGTKKLMFMYAGSSYLFMRVLGRMYSFKEVDSLVDWAKSGWHWISLMEACAVLASAFLFQAQPNDKSSTFIALTIASGLQWFSLLIILRPASQHFVLFWTGLLSVITKLVPFIITSLVFLAAFVFMLLFSNKYSSSKCSENACSLSYILKTVVSNLVNSSIDSTYKMPALVLIVTYAFGLFVVILQLNILIAVVNKEFQESRSLGKRIFWKERLYYVSETNFIFRCSPNFSNTFRNIYLRNKWEGFSEFLFFPKRHKLAVAVTGTQDYRSRRGYNFKIIRSFERFLYFLFIPVWFVAGFFTLGYIWPPQFNEYILNGDIDDEEEEQENIEKLLCKVTKMLEDRESVVDRRLKRLESKMKSLIDLDSSMRKLESSLMNIHK